MRVAYCVQVMLISCIGIAQPRSAMAATLDRYGGYTGLRGHNRGRFFRVELLDDRYYLITPSNHAFISAAMTTANFADRWGGFCPTLDSYPNPYGNQAKYNNDRDAWRHDLKSMLRRWGFNGLGCWCDQGVPQITENAACLFITPRAYKLGVAKIGRDFPDVFDPRFAQAADERAKSLAKLAGSRYRIGAFPDNELGWVGADYWGKRDGPTLPDAFIAQPADVPGKQYWAEVFLKNRYKSIKKLNAAYGTSFDDFGGKGNTLINVQELPNTPERPSIYEDKKDFAEAIADQYYRIVTAAMRHHDPNHLVFSARWALWTTAFDVSFKEHQAYNERIWKKAGQYCDIIAINSYMENASLEEHHKLYSRVFAQTGKPFMITEWATLADDTQFARNKGWRRFQRERGEFYFDQFKKLLDFKFKGPDGETVHPCLGAQWFQYYDEPSLGRTDGEKANFGLVNVKDEPYVTALDVMGTFNAQLYDYVVEGKELRLLEAPTPQSPKGEVTAAQPVDDLNGLPKVSATPKFEWVLPEGGTSATLLYSPEKCFPEAQTIRQDRIKDTSFAPREPLAAGLWYWCVRAVDASRLGGRYSDPVPFYVEKAGAEARAQACLAFEDLSGWRNVSLEDAGWNGVVWSFADTRQKRSGRSSARVQFTLNSINKKSGKQNERKGEIVWRYVGPALKLTRGTHLTLEVMPNRAVDVKGETTVASKFLSVRVTDTDQKVLLDAPLDAKGEMTPLKWAKCRFALERPHAGQIESIQFYLDASKEGVPWDQRLYVWIDNLRFTTGR